jgi:hypothetical protein
LFDGGMIGRNRGRPVQRHHGDRVLWQQMLAHELDRTVERLRRLLDTAETEHDDECPASGRHEPRLPISDDRHRGFGCRRRREHLRKERGDLARPAVLEDLEICLCQTGDGPALLVGDRDRDRYQSRAATENRPLLLREHEGRRSDHRNQQRRFHGEIVAGLRSASAF